MLHIEWIARDRLHKFRDQLRKVASAEFLNKSTYAALRSIEDDIEKLDNNIDALSKLSSSKFLFQHVVTINQKLFSYSNALGVLLRSTNLRNAFEAYFSFNQMATNVIGQSDRLIISSEWDAIPFYIPSPPDALSSFVIIGIPAFVSRNSLLLPLAAHELGHAVWRIKQIDGPLSTTADLHFDDYVKTNSDKFRSEFNLNDNLFLQTDTEVIQSECLKLVSSQSEEIFCDFFGSLLFGESYLYAFDAFLSPGFGRREPRYPALSRRSAYLKKVTLPDPKSLRKEVLNPEYFEVADGLPSRSAIVRLADEVSEKLEPALLDQARRYANEARAQLEGGDNAETMMKNLRAGIPPDQPRSAVDILNAIWRVYFERLDQETSDIGRANIHSSMNNLCLKSLEIYEYRYRQRHGWSTT